MEAGDLLLEIDRQTALLIYQILETPEERQFDDIVFLASEVCSTPIALVSFLEEGRQWFKARVGFPMCETDISSSVCRFVVEAESPLVIPDLSQDPRKSDNPLVTGSEAIRFYAGHPIRTQYGVLGSLCVIDHSPRPEGLREGAMACLAALSRLAVDRLEARRLAYDYKNALSVMT